jgi:hypothetical protein
MAGNFDITMHQEFAQELTKLADMLRTWDSSLMTNLIRVLRIVGKRWQGEAIKRVPVDFGTLKERILTETYQEGNSFTTACGTNLPYGKYVEFGTRTIAGGRVLALGDGPDITDAQAIKLWPAKNFGSGAINPKTGSRERGGFINETTGKANMRAVSADLRRHERGAPSEQMPWLRPSLNAIKSWAIEMIQEAMIPPSQGRGAA